MDTSSQTKTIRASILDNLTFKVKLDTDGLNPMKWGMQYIYVIST